MKQLDILWEYQEFDLQVDQFENEKRNSELRKKLLKLKNYLVSRDKQLVKLDTEAEKKNQYYKRIKDDYESLLSTINERKEIMEAGQVTELDELQKLVREGLSIQTKIRRKDEELRKLLKELEEFQKKLDDILKGVGKAKKDYKIIKKDYDKEILVIKGKQDKIKAKRDKIAEKVDKTLLAKYKNLKINRTPVIAIFENDQCSGCYMSLASLVAQKVKDKKSIIECENCGRLLYYRD